MILESFVTSIVAAIVYDTGKSIVKEVHSSSQEKELKKSLNQYLTLQMSRYGEEGTSIIEAIPLPKWNGQIYRELIASGADCDYCADVFGSGCPNQKDCPLYLSAPKEIQR